MRTVTFSDPKVSQLINANFVALWLNRADAFHNENYSTENWIYQNHGEAYPTQNICTFFLTPDAQVFHYVAGYYSPDLFRRDLQATLRIRWSAFDEKMQLTSLEQLRRLHRDEAARIEKDPITLPALPSYRGAAHTHTDACIRSAKIGALYLSAVHKRWSERSALPTFEDVRYRYAYGDPFTEEPRHKVRQIEGTNLLEGVKVEP
jgi:hypothetical protein